jgi:hypothetical protein
MFEAVRSGGSRRSARRGERLRREVVGTRGHSRIASGISSRFQAQSPLVPALLAGLFTWLVTGAGAST